MRYPVARPYAVLDLVGGYSMQQRFDTTLIVDGQGTARIEGTVAVPPGRHWAIVLVDDPTLRAAETWEAFIERPSVRSLGAISRDIPTVSTSSETRSPDLSARHGYLYRVPLGARSRAPKALHRSRRAGDCRTESRAWRAHLRGGAKSGSTPSQAGSRCIPRALRLAPIRRHRGRYLRPHPRPLGREWDDHRAE